MTLQIPSFVLCLSALFALAACSSGVQPGDPGGSGGLEAGVGGIPNAGGATSSGGTTAAGGTTLSTGGAGVGGTVGVGGGVSATGGAANVGGAGGGAADGGAPAAGGGDGTGGAGEPEFHIYLAVGQSNMAGAAHVPQAPAMAPFHERVEILQSETCPSGDNNPHPYGEWREMFIPIVMCQEGSRDLPGGGQAPIGLGPADSFAVAMAEASGPNVTIGIVGAAHGDTGIDQHLPSCTSNCLPSWANNTINGAPVVNGQVTPFNWVVDLAKKAQTRGVIKGIIFHQGENNAGQSTWPSKVNQYVTALRTELNLEATEVPFIAGELPRTGGSAASHNPLVQQIPSVVENGHYVSSGPMPDGTVLGDRGDALHWSTFSVIEMGKRYADKMLEAQGKK